MMRLIRNLISNSTRIAQFPRAQIKASTVWVMGILFIVVGGGVLLVGLSSPLWTTFLIGAVCLYDWCHKKWVGSVWIMGSCRTLLWLVAGSAGSAEIMDTVMVCSLCLGGYVVGISLFARNESRESKPAAPAPSRFFCFFNPCLLTLGLVVMWNNLDPTRVFLLNISGLFLGWIVFNAILRMKNTTAQGIHWTGCIHSPRWDLFSRCPGSLFLRPNPDCTVLCRPIFCTYSTKEVCGNLGPKHTLCDYALSFRHHKPKYSVGFQPQCVFHPRLIFSNK